MSERYVWSQRVVHWLMVALLISTYLIGLHMTAAGFGHGVRAEDAATGDWLAAIHKLLGIVILFLALIRVSMRLMLGSPPTPPYQERIITYLALAGQIGLYFLMIAIPLLGWLSLSAAGVDSGFLSLEPLVEFSLPPLIDEDWDLYERLRSLHADFGLAFALLVGAHVCFAIIYIIRRLVRGRGEFPRIWFRL